MCFQRIDFRNPFENEVNGIERQANSRSDSEITMVSPLDDTEPTRRGLSVQPPSPVSTSNLPARERMNNPALTPDQFLDQGVSSPAPTQPQVIYEGPLRLIRRQALLDASLTAVVQFLDRVCPTSGGKVIQRDPFIPQVVYMVEYEMEAGDRAAFRHMMDVFGFASAFNESLFHADMSAMGDGWVYGWTIPQNGDLEALLQDLVARNCLGLTYDVDKPWEGPTRNAPIQEDVETFFLRRR